MDEVSLFLKGSQPCSVFLQSWRQWYDPLVMPREVLLSLRQFEWDSLCCHSSTSSSILLHPSLPVAPSSCTHPCSSTILLCPSLSVAIPKVGAVASTVAVERKLSSLGLEQVEENLQGPAFKAALLGSTHLPAVACPVHVLRAWSDMPSVRARLGAEMWACILKWWFLLTSSPLTWCNRSSLTVPGFWQFRGLQGVEPDLFCIAAGIHLGQWLKGDLSVCKSWRILRVWRASIHLLHKGNSWKNNWTGKSLFQSEACCFLSYSKTLFFKQHIWFSKCTWEPLPMSSQPLCSAEPFHSTSMPCARHHLWHNTVNNADTQAGIFLNRNCTVQAWTMYGGGPLKQDRAVV